MQRWIFTGSMERTSSALVVIYVIYSFISQTRLHKMGSAGSCLPSLKRVSFACRRLSVVWQERFACSAMKLGHFRPDVSHLVKLVCLLFPPVLFVLLNSFRLSQFLHFARSLSSTSWKLPIWPGMVFCRFLNIPLLLLTFHVSSITSQSAVSTKFFKLVSSISVLTNCKLALQSSVGRCPTVGTNGLPGDYSAQCLCNRSVTFVKVSYFLNSDITYFLHFAASLGRNGLSRTSWAHGISRRKGIGRPQRNSGSQSQLILKIFYFEWRHAYLFSGRKRQ